MTKKPRSRIKRTAHTKVMLPILIIVIVAVGGAYVLRASHAASPYVSTTADKGTVVASASKVGQCSGSSDGTCVLFGAAGGSSGGTQTTSCFPSPGACGYPDPAYSTVGVGAGGVACSALTPSGSVTVSINGQTVQNLNISGQLNINADNVTVNNVCVTYNGGGASGSIAAEAGGANDTIQNSTIRGANAGSQSVDQAVASYGSNLTLSHDYVYNCGECLHDSPFVVNDSFIEVNANISGEHYEDVFLNANNSGGSLVANHDTMFNIWDQTAVIFGSVQNGGNYNQEPCHNHITLTNSLIAGSGYMIYECSGVTQVGTATMNIADNRFARCLTLPLVQTSGGNEHCSGSGTNGADSSGLYPYGGSYGADSYTFCGDSGQTWSGNVYDNDNSTVSC